MKNKIESEDLVQFVALYLLGMMLSDYHIISVNWTKLEQRTISCGGHLEVC